MTRLSVHSAGDKLLVCGDNGRLWMLDASVSRLEDAAVQRSLAALREFARDGSAPPSTSSDITVSCLNDLFALARNITRPTTVRWTYAGRIHRTRLAPSNAEAVAGVVSERLLSTIPDAHAAATLAAAPLRDEISTAAGIEVASSPAAGTIERWTDEGWSPYRFDPPPLVDAVTGILHRIVERPYERAAPTDFVHLHAELPHLSSIDPRFQPDPLAPAAGFRGMSPSPENEAVLSGVAHVCGAYLGQGTQRIATALELRHAGDRVLTVGEWRPHDPALHEHAGFPFVRDRPDLRMPWLQGEDASGPCWAPLSLVHAGYLASGIDDLPRTNGHNLAGLQAGFSEDEAKDRAAAHLIGQDAVSRWWSQHARLPEVPIPHRLRAGWGDSPWRARVLAVPTRFAVPVRLAVVDDPVDDVIALGIGCAATDDDASMRALSEALLQHACARDLARADSLIRNAPALGNGGVAGLAPHHPERRYAAAFTDRRGMIDPMCHVQFGLDPRIVDDTRARTTPRGQHSSRPNRLPISPFRALSGAGERVVSVDVTTARARAAGAHAVRLLAPRLERLAVAAFPSSTAATPYPGW